MKSTWSITYCYTDHQQTYEIFAPTAYHQRYLRPHLKLVSAGGVPASTLKKINAFLESRIDPEGFGRSISEVPLRRLGGLSKKGKGG